MSLTATPGQETVAPARRPGTPATPGVQVHAGALSTCSLRHAGDDRLVALARAGSERAFAEIMRRYQRPLQFYCLHLVGAPRAEDAVQQAFLQAFVSLRDGARREIALRPWLYRIARNCAIDLLRKQPFEHDELDPEFDGVPQTPGVFEQKEELARIVAAIQALPEGQRRALTLRELEGRSYGEISAELGHTDSGVRQLIFRARTALRNLGALLIPLDSVRWRLIGSSPTIADPHQLAAAASVSSTGGGNVLQAAASAVAATVTLLASAPADRQTAQAPARTPARTAAPPLGFASFTGTAASVEVRTRHGRAVRRVLLRSGGAPTPDLREEIAPVPPALTEPASAPAPIAPPVADVPPALPTALADAPPAAGLDAAAGAGAPAASTAPALDRAAADAQTGDGRLPAPTKAATPVAKPAPMPVASKPAPAPVKPISKPAMPPKVTVPKPPLPKAPPKPAVPKPAVPKPAVPKVAVPKVVLPKPGPRKSASVKAPAVPQKPSIPTA